MDADRKMVYVPAYILASRLKDHYYSVCILQYHVRYTQLSNKNLAQQGSNFKSEK